MSLDDPWWRHSVSELVDLMFFPPKRGFSRWFMFGDCPCGPQRRGAPVRIRRLGRLYGSKKRKRIIWNTSLWQVRQPQWITCGPVWVQVPCYLDQLGSKGAFQAKGLPELGYLTVKTPGPPKGFHFGRPYYVVTWPQETQDRAGDLDTFPRAGLDFLTYGCVDKTSCCFSLDRYQRLHFTVWFCGIERSSKMCLIGPGKWFKDLKHQVILK